jgi:hypothetical protein
VNQVKAENVMDAISETCGKAKENCTLKSMSKQALGELKEAGEIASATRPKLNSDASGG